MPVNAPVRQNAVSQAASPPGPPRRRRALPAALLFALLALPAAAQNKFSIFDQVWARGAGLTPAKGQVFYTSDALGTISPLPAGGTGYCLVISGAGVPQWSNACTGIVSSVALTAPTQFSVSGSPVTSSGTLALSWQNVSQNYGLFGPTSGSGAPTFRGMIGPDMPVFVASGVGHLQGAVPDPGASAGSTRFLREDATWSATASGTVSSVALSAPGEFTVSGSPVTASGTLTFAWGTSVPLHYALMSGIMISHTPSFRAIDPTDLPVMTATTAGIVPTPPNDSGQLLKGDGTWGSISGGGTVTSVAVTVPSFMSVSGSPITGSGTFGLTFNNSTSHYVFAEALNNASVGLRLLDPTDLGLTTKGDLLGITATPAFSRLPVGTNGYILSADSTQTTGLKWIAVPGTGTVTSVDMSVPTGFGISGNPVTVSGTLALAFGSTTAYKFLRTDSGGTVAWGDLTTAGQPAHYIGILQPSGAGHNAGLAPDTPSGAGTTHFLREDSSWALPPQGTVTSVAMTVPGEISLSGSPITTSGTLGLGWNAETANYVFAGPTSGGANTPAFRLLVAADLPVFVASGSSHAKGAVPDPGVSAGTTHFLREDSTWQVPTFSSSIEVKADSGSPDVTGVSVMAFDHTTLSVTNNSGGQVTVGCPGCTGTGSFASAQDQWNGDGSTTVFTLSHTPVTNGIQYVSLNGLPQPTTAFSVSSSNVTMTTAPITGALLAVGYFTSLASTATNMQDDFTGAGATDFTLSHAPVVAGVLFVSIRGLVQPTSSWSLVAGTTLRMASAVPSGDVVSCRYLY